MTKKGKSPTDQEIEHAFQTLDARARGLDQLRTEFIGHFSARAPLDRFSLLEQGEAAFRAYIFFRTNDDLERARSSRLDHEMMEFLYLGLEQLGKGTRDQIDVAFEFDSYENVCADYEGDYFLRLR